VPIAFVTLSVLSLATSSAYMIFYAWIIADVALLYFLNQKRTHSDSEIPDVKVSRERRVASEQWWVEKQLAQREAEKWPGMNEEKDHDKNKTGSEDDKSSK
jgi:hypothetical protein